MPMPVHDFPFAARELSQGVDMPAILEPVSQGMDMTTLLTALTALKKGDFTVRLPLDWTGVAGKVADTFNEVIELNERMANELERISRVVGK